MALEWEDASSYRRGQRGKVDPSTWKACVDGVTVIVTQHVDYGDEWVLTAQEVHERRRWGLGTDDANEAKRIGAAKAAAMLERKANKMLEAAEALKEG